MVEELGGQQLPSPLIEVFRPIRNPAAYEELAKLHPHLFSFHIQTQAKWTETQLIALRRADVVLTVAGMKGTYESGLVAIVAKKKLVPVASFGGASAKLSAALESVIEPRYQNGIRSLNGPWTAHSVGQVMKQIGIASRPTVLIIHGRSADWQSLREWLRTKAEIQEVIVMKDEHGDGKTLPEKFEQLASRVDKAIAVATPDDLGEFASCDYSKFRPRARQNVWLEVGWFWGRLGRTSLMVLSRGEIELPSDLTGLELYAYQKDPTEQSEKLRSFLGLQYGRGS
jgi:hypothetical protein